LSRKSAFRVFEKPPIEESYDYAEQVRRQIERCLESSSIQDKELREGTYQACVLALADLVPFDDQNEEFKDSLDKCTVDKEKWVYRKRGGRKIGTPDNIVNESPKLTPYPETDWNKYFQVLFNKFVELKVTVRRGSFSV